MTEGKPSTVEKSQAEKFKEAARELGCDESEERFEDALRKIGRAKPAKETGATGAPEEPKPTKPKSSPR